MKDYKRQIMGQRNKSNGALFEQYIENACKRYLELDIAYIEKTPETFHVSQNNRDGTFTGYYEKKCQPDFKGILCDGTGIMFEAKHTDADNIKQSVVTEYQWKSLDSYERYGARCYVMVSIQFTYFYRIPWQVWKSMKNLFGHKYMNKKELDPYRLKRTFQMVHILDGIELNN